jgi:hypothetical protein
VLAARSSSANNTKDPPLRGMNEMRTPTHSNLSSLVWLFASAVAACGGAGHDGLVTVGVRPTAEAAASGSTAAGGAGGLPIPGRDVMNQLLAGNSTTTGDLAPAGASGALAGTFAIAGSGTTAEGRDGATPLAGAATAGAGGAAIGAAGADGSLGPNEDECGAIPSQLAGRVTSGRVSGSGLIEYDINPPNMFTGLRTTLAVPAEPAPNGQIFIWPGIQPTPSGVNFQPIGNGVLEAVLTWGPSCGPDAPASYSTWWIAPMYVNISSSDPQYSGCRGGKVAPAEPQQLLAIEMHLDGTKWVQKVVSRSTMRVSEFSLDLKGQAQGRAFFDIELQTSNKPTEDIIFTNTVLSMDTSDPNACQPVMRGMNDFASKPRVSADGKHCCIDRIVLRAAGVMATTMDPP